jgi:hypothetical protein
MWTTAATTTSSIALTSRSSGRTVIKPLTRSSLVSAFFILSNSLTRYRWTRYRWTRTPHPPHTPRDGRPARPLLVLRLRCPPQGAFLCRKVGRVGSCGGHNRVLDAPNRGAACQSSSLCSLTCTVPTLIVNLRAAIISNELAYLIRLSL